ncbi:MAG TPA: HD domain-containing protein, partial [Ardenticatenaceae bacterium]|nr:HD domain-containing protein [Ardenticatenaceae bacterium]
YHVARVWRSARAIAATEPDVDYEILDAAGLLHDIGEKQPGRGNALVDVETLAQLLAPFEVPPEKYARIVQAINEHSFSRGWAPGSIEAAILQDADRLDAIGAIGVARAFAVGGARGRPLYDPSDPTNSLQHFYDKLLKLKDRMNTAEGRRLAGRRHAFLEQFLAEFLREWGEPG